MQMLVVGVPLLVVALTPVLFIVATLFHSIGLLTGAILSLITGMWSMGGVVGTMVGKLAMGIGPIGEWLAGLFGVGKATKAAATGAAVVGDAVAAAGGAAGKATGLFAGLLGAGASLGDVFAALFNGLLTFAKANPIILIGTSIVGVFGILSRFGLNLGKYFVQLADSARAWGARLMETYGSGMLAGAARAISRVINTIAGWISNFFEAHSPPKMGPLRSIDKWGTNLMNTYLKGFLLADFSILDDVGGMMQEAFSIFEDLGQIGEGSANGLFAGVRQSLAQVIEIFNQTGEIAEGVLDKIGNALGAWVLITRTDQITVAV